MTFRVLWTVSVFVVFGRCALADVDNPSRIHAASSTHLPSPSVIPTPYLSANKPLLWHFCLPDIMHDVEFACCLPRIRLFLVPVALRYRTLHLRCYRVVVVSDVSAATFIATTPYYAVVIGRSLWVILTCSITGIHFCWDVVFSADTWMARCDIGRDRCLA